MAARCRSPPTSPWRAAARADPGWRAAHHGRRARRARRMEMTKWFDTNYHYIVPEFCARARASALAAAQGRSTSSARRRRSASRHARCWSGPVTFLLLGKARTRRSIRSRCCRSCCRSMPSCWASSAEPAPTGCRSTSRAGARPRSAESACACARPTRQLASRAAAQAPAGHLLRRAAATTCDTACSLPVAGLHLDLVRAPERARCRCSRRLPADRVLVARRGRRPQRLAHRPRPCCSTRLETPLAREARRERVGSRRPARCCTCRSTWRGDASSTPSCSSWLAFADAEARRARERWPRRCNERHATRSTALEPERPRASPRAAASPRVHDPAVARAPGRGDAGHGAAQTPSRSAPRRRQRALLDLPPFPTTTIGSFPQTAEVREARAAHASGDARRRRLRRRSCETETEHARARQEALGLDVLVHGEFERNDMVEYFGEQLDGFAFTEHGWVQCYGSRCVKPPIIFGDVSRPEADDGATGRRYAQSLTEQADEGHADRPGHDPATGRSCATTSPRGRPAGRSRWRSATRSLDLEAAGIAHHPDRRAGAARGPAAAPRATGRPTCDWAVDVASASPPPACADETQIHTHMCYSEFNDIIAVDRRRWTPT